MLHALDRSDIDGFYGEPAEFDPTLEVELAVVDEDAITTKIPRIVAVAALDGDALADEWFGSFDENAEHPISEFDDMPTTTWQRLGGWLRNLGRAA